MMTMRSNRTVAVLALSVALSGLVLLSGAAQAKFLKSIWGPYEMPAGTPVPDAGRPVLAVPRLQGTRRRSRPVPAPLGRGRPHPPEQTSGPRRPRLRLGTDRRIRQRGQGHPVEMAAMLTASPGWANGSRPPIWAPKNPKDFANFAYAAAKRYPDPPLDDLGRAEPGRKLPAAEGEPPGGRRIYAKFSTRPTGR